MAHRQRFLLVFLAVLAALLAACGATIDQTITFNADEAWETEVSLGFPAEVAPLLGGQLDGQLQSLQQDIEAQGGQMTWEQRQQDDGGLTYQIEASGRGYDILQSVAFGEMDVAVSEQNGQRQLTFTAARPAEASSHSLAVVGGEILSSNGQVTGGDTVRWVDAPFMQAVLTERGAAASLPWLPILGGLALVLGGGALALFLLRRRAAPAPAWNAPPAAPYETPPPAFPPPAGDAPNGLAGKAAIAPGAAPAGHFCVNCGASLRPGARFCAVCGHQQPQ